MAGLWIIAPLAPIRGSAGLSYQRLLRGHRRYRRRIQVPVWLRAGIALARSLDEIPKRRRDRRGKPADAEHRQQRHLQVVSDGRND